MAQAYSKVQNSSLAVKILSIALGKNKNDVQAATWLAHEQIRMNKDRDALATLKDALERNPKYEPAYLELSNLYEKKNNKYELRMLYVDMIQKVGPRPLYLENLCKLYTIGGFFEEGKAICRDGITADKNNPKNYLNLAVCLRDTGHKDEAKSLMKRAADNFTNDEESQMLFAKFLEVDEKNLSQALQYYKAAVNANPNSAKAWIGVANVQLDLLKYSESLEAYKRACSLSRIAIQETRHAIAVLRTSKSEEWLPQFDHLAETCALGLSGRP